MAKGEKDNLNEIPIVKCPGAIKVPTEKEREALDNLREIKMKVRELKERLGRLQSEKAGKDEGEVTAINALLNELREQWDKWQKKREEAATERMILLGHEEGPTLGGN